MLGIGDDVREAPGSDREEPDGLVGRVAERVQSGTSLGTEDEVARGELAPSPSWLRKSGRPLRTKNISSAPKCMWSRASGAPGASSYSVAPSLASSGRQKIRCRVVVSSCSPSHASEKRFCRVMCGTSES